MPAQYPSAIVTTTQLPTTRADATLMATNHAADHDNLALEVIAIETELGVAPKGTYATVRARLDAIQAAPVYTVTNATTDRSIDENNTTITELINIVATLIADLKVAKILG